MNCINVSAGVSIGRGGSGGVTLQGVGLYVSAGVTIGMNGLFVTGGMTVQGTAWSQSAWTTTGVTSDLRLIKQIQPLSNSLAKINKLRGVHFSWKVDEISDLSADEGRHIGVIAQDVQQVLPEVVSEINGGKYLGVDYTALIPVLLESIRELDIKNKALEDRVSRLEKFLVDSLVTHERERVF